jgi:hypothetical protein
LALLKDSEAIDCEVTRAVTVRDPTGSAIWPVPATVSLKVHFKAPPLAGASISPGTVTVVPVKRFVASVYDVQSIVGADRVVCSTMGPTAALSGFSTMAVYCMAAPGSR